MKRRLLLIAPVLAGTLVLGACEQEEPAPVAEAPVAEAPVAEVQPTTPPVAPEPTAQTAGIPVSQIIESPATWTGRTVTGEVRVTQVVSDRGFWIEDQGERLFVVINEAAGERPNIQAGQTLRIREAVVRDPTFVANLPGTISQETRNALQGQAAFLTTDAQNINIVGQGM